MTVAIVYLLRDEWIGSRLLPELLMFCLNVAGEVELARFNAR
jgi:hypothetical protein